MLNGVTVFDATRPCRRTHPGSFGLGGPGEPKGRSVEKVSPVRVYGEREAAAAWRLMKSSRHLPDDAKASGVSSPVGCAVELQRQRLLDDAVVDF